MQWFKHQSDFRNSTQMKSIQRVCGSPGVAAAYRLIEVCAQKYKADEGNDVIVLEAPLTKDALALELLVEIVEDDGGYFETRSPRAEDVEEYLQAFAKAGLIERGSVTFDGRRWKKGEGGFEPCKITYETLRLVGLEQQMDDYTRQRKAKAAKNGEQFHAGLTTPK